MTNFNQFFNNQQNLQIIEGMQPNHFRVYSPGLLSPTSSSRKNKRTELDDRRLTFCHAKVEGTKALVFPPPPPLAKMLGDMSASPQFCTHDSDPNWGHNTAFENPEPTV